MTTLAQQAIQVNKAIDTILNDQEYLTSLSTSLDNLTSYIVVIEGLDLTGKTTFIKEATTILEKSKLTAVTIPFPKVTSPLLKTYLRSDKPSLNFKKEKVLFSILNNVTGLENSLRRLTTTPDIIFLDRYIPSSFVYDTTLPERRDKEYFYYHKGEFNAGYRLLKDLVSINRKLICPDVYLYFYADQEERRRRMNNRLNHLTQTNQISEFEALCDQLTVELQPKYEDKYKLINNTFRNDFKVPTTSYKSTNLEDLRHYARMFIETYLEEVYRR